MAPSLWPNYPPPPATPAWRMLAEIVYKAHVANAPNFDLINFLAFRCAANQSGDPADAEHLVKIQSALTAANSGWWGVVAIELDHEM